MGKANEITEKLKNTFKDSIIEIKVPKERRLFVRVKAESFKQILKYLVKDLEFRHLSTITGVDSTKGIELLYHLAQHGSTELSLGLTIPKDDARIPTVTDLIPSAVLYEREVHELLGVSFEGHPDMSLLFLPEAWPHGVYPLRKERTFDELRRIGEK